MRILVADDHALFRGSLKKLLEAKGYEVLEAGTGSEVLERVHSGEPDLVLLDLQLPDISGIEVTRRLTAEAPRTSVLILTGAGEGEDLVEVLSAGAQGYLLKSLEPDKFFDLLERALGGEPALAPALARKVVRELTRDRKPKPPVQMGPSELTDRETQVLRLMVTGVTATRDLALRLGVTESTVKFHVRNILEKLQLKSRAQVVSWAVRHGVVDLPG